MKKTGNRARWVSVFITLLLIFSAIVISFTQAQGNIKAVNIKAENIDEKLSTLKEEGCLPAREGDKAIVVLINKIETVDDAVAQLMTEQRDGFQLIMNKLNNEKPE